MAADFVAHCLELLSPLGTVRARRMFGGHGLYCDDLFFGLIASDCLYLKADATTQAAFAAAGGRPFVYNARTGAIAMSYWAVPAEAMESPALMQPWARQALSVALRAKAAKASATPRKPRAVRPQTQASKPRRKP